MKRAFLITAAVALMLPAGAGAATRSTVTIDSYQMGVWYGKVKSPKKKCKDHRRVTLFHKDSGPDTRIGRDRAVPGKLNAYLWSIPQQKPLGGPYYAKIEAGSGCKGDRSEIYTLM
jgi:hypothetical protein